MEHILQRLLFFRPFLQRAGAALFRPIHFVKRGLLIPALWMQLSNPPQKPQQLAGILLPKHLHNLMYRRKKGALCLAENRLPLLRQHQVNKAPILLCGKLDDIPLLLQIID